MHSALARLPFRLNPIPLLRNLTSPRSLSSSSFPLTKSGSSFATRRSPTSRPLTVLESFLGSVASFPANPFLGSRDDADSDYTYTSYSSTWSTIRSLTHSLSILPSFHNPVILLPNNPSNLIITYAAYCRAVPTIPLYTTLGPSALQHIVNETQSDCYFVDTSLLENFLDALAGCAALPDATLVLCGSFEVPSNVLHLAQSRFKTITTLTDLTTAGDAARQALYGDKPLEPDHPSDCGYITPPQPNTPATISYTSGTTSDPKGVVLRHSNISAICHDVFQPSRIDIDENTRHFSYLPLPHIFERAVSSGIAGGGGSISFIRSDPNPKIQASFLVDDMVAVKPTVFCCAPRVVNKLKGNVEMAIEDGSLKGNLVKTALENKMAAFKASNDTVSHPVYDLLTGAISAKIGLDKVETVICGSAPIDGDALAFFSVLLPKAKVLEGYGLTESSGGVAINNAFNYPDYKSFGTVGEPVGECEIKLVDHEHKGAGAERGEIWIRGANVSDGYYDGTDDAGRMKIKSIQDKDGWFATGDVGVWDEETGGLRIVDRIKNIFKLQQGEFVSVEKIEGVVNSNVNYVEQCWAYGDGLRRYIVGVVTLDENWRKKAVAQLKDGETLEDVVLRDVYAACKNANLQGFECIKKIRIHDEPFSSVNGFATPTFKLIRNKLKEEFMDDIERMYAELEEENK